MIGGLEMLEKSGPVWAPLYEDFVIEAGCMSDAVELYEGRG